MRKHILLQTILSGSTTPEIPWYLSGGIVSADCIAAYQPLWADSYAASKVNLAHPGANDLTELNAELSWSHDRGWLGNANSRHLKTGITANRNYTMIVRFADNNTGDYGAACGTMSGKPFAIIPSNGTNVTYGNGNYLNGAGIKGSGVLAIAGGTGYREDASDGSIADAAGTYAEIYIMGANGQVQYFHGRIYAVAIYNRTLTLDEYKAVRSAMLAIPTVTANPADASTRGQYIALKAGAIFHFNMATFGTLDLAPANQALDTFAPTGLDINQWMDALVSAGLKYAYLTVKHHDGFALWPTAYRVGENLAYSIGGTTWYGGSGTDIVNEFVTQCAAHNIKPCLYFSILDQTFEARKVGFTYAEYITMIQTQLTELLTNYGDITAIWFDGWGWSMGYNNIPYATIYNHVKGLQANCLVIENSHTHPTVTSEIEVYETLIASDLSIPPGNTRWCEEINTTRMDGHWFYHATDGQTAAAFRAAAVYLNPWIAWAVRNFSTFNLGLTPGTDGTLPAAQVTMLGSVVVP